MLKVGITGGIGSGKSTVARIFQVLGIPVYNADDAAKRLMNEDAGIRQQIIASFGSESYSDMGLNRSYMAGIVFNNPEKLAQLNAIIHPATIRDAATWMNQQESPYSLKEAALLFETGSVEQLDFVIGVYAPEALRIKRVMLRDSIGREEVKARMSRQMDENIKMKLCDAVIKNDDQQLVIPQVLEMHERLMKMSEVR